MTQELIVRKDGSSAIENSNGIGVDIDSVRRIVGQHVLLRADGNRTAQVSSGAVLEGKRGVLEMGDDPETYDDKTLAMIGMPSHFMSWTLAAQESGLIVASSLSTEIELRHSKEGKEIRGGMGQAIQHEKVLLVSNYHDEADSREMKRYQAARRRIERMFIQRMFRRSTLLRTESEENDFHAANVAIAAGASWLLLCTGIDGFRRHGKKVDQLHVDDIDKALEDCKESSVNGKGGMQTKLQAARRAARHGITVIIGDTMEDSRRLMEGSVGTRVVK